MTATIKILWGILGLGLLCGMIALSTWGIPAPSTEVIKEIPYQKIFKSQE